MRTSYIAVAVAVIGVAAFVFGLWSASQVSASMNAYTAAGYDTSEASTSQGYLISFSIAAVGLALAVAGGIRLVRDSAVRTDREAPLESSTTSATPAVGYTSVADEIAKFAAMRDSGILTDDEFEKKKRELLG